ncbi:hypothetical protein ACI3KS_00130 [Microbacterium sp. ZW T5_45]|uniref:hypothetical protein n=1 Tax=Microbacterium sp. ZW T5_45 TaxID=3378080 RepID=UPI003852B24A
MKHAIIKTAAIAAIAAAAVLSVSTSAIAYTPPETGGVSNPNVEPGGAFEFTAPPANFLPGETVAISLTGENASGASLGFVKFAVETAILGTVTATDGGGLGGVSIRLPANASGPYTVLATSPSNPIGVAASVSAGDPEPTADADGGSSTSAGTAEGSATASGTGTAAGTGGTGTAGTANGSSPADGGSATAPVADGLATTGTDGEALLALWVGGGALALVGGGIAVASTVRRNAKRSTI